MENNESCGAGSSANSAYVLDNAGKEASARFAALAGVMVNIESVWDRLK